ncbi:MAG: acyl-CoA/acyl-ACP dehydrogenase [Thermoplasmata archaeon]|nr:acyl-CoA/acyl-ACP dehydrogenase [Thermoplasmata archaeon]
MTTPMAPGVESPIAREVHDAVERLKLSERSAELDRNPSFPRAEFRALGEANLLGLRTPVSLGGRGLPLPDAGLALYHLAYRAGSTTFAKLALQPDFSSVLGVHGSAELVENYFRPMTRGKVLVANHVTEPEAGSDAQAIRCTAEKVGSRYILSGVKSQVAFALDADAAIVYARTAESGNGMTAILVPQELPGIRREVIPDLGEKWMRRGMISYDRVEVPTSHRIGEEGAAFGYLKDEMTHERALLAALYLGVGRASWEETVDHVKTRMAFGRPLSQQQAVSFPLVEAWASLDSAWLFVENVLIRMQAGEPMTGPAALAKWLATETALRCADLGIQFHGGRGYSSSLPHEQRWRDVRSGAIAHGPSEIMHLIASRDLWPRERPPVASPPK